MKKLLGAILVFTVGYYLPASAQNCGNDFLGTKTRYKNPGVKYTAVPAGYKAVFINHVGRHGARHLTKDVSSYFAYKLVMRADSADALTAQGKQLRQMVTGLDKVEKGNTKSISGEGRAELAGLGERMYAFNKNIFKGQSHINVAITKEVRTKQSADAFLSGLKHRLKDSVVVNEYNDDTNLRFYDASPAYKKFEEDGEWVKYKSALESAEHAPSIEKAFIAKFFAPGYLKSINDDDRDQFVNDIFGFATIVYSLRDEVKQAGLKADDMDFIQFFSCPQITALAKIDLADEYFKKGPGIDINGIQVRIAAPLLINFIKTSDDFIKSGNVTAQLRFAHAETIAPIAALMGISAADKATMDIATLGKLWQASKIIPLSANIQWVFYKKAGSEKYLVKILLNEREAHITGLKNGFPYYKWDDLRGMYLKKLQKLNVKLDDDMKAYLHNLN